MQSIIFDKFNNELLKKFRIEKKITQESIANIIGISRIAYQNIESGKSQPKLKTYMKIMEYINEYKKGDIIK